MYLHIGNDYMINTKDLVGIFDIEKASTSQITKDFLNKASKLDRIVYTTMEMPKSFLVCFDSKNLSETIYISQLACSTLKKRVKQAYDNYRL